ncbi:MAG: FG-GAP-like repeat-containing protein [Candidatus Thermoplasmatota archaeon]|nr:FG-GAP-like repeat-containing protein [Candidatus Thermoplasmatota archaeon]
MNAKSIGIVILISLLLNGFVFAIPCDTGSKESFFHEEHGAAEPQAFQADDEYGIQWEKDYGKLWWWSARYEGPQPVGDADNDGKNELLIGGRDPFMRVMKWDESKQTYYEQQKIIDPVFGIGYGIWVRLGSNYYNVPQPFGSATGFSIADIDNDGENEIGVAWGCHFSAFKWNGQRYQLMGRYIVISERQGQYGTTLDCVVGDYDNDGKNEVIVTGGYDVTPELVAIQWDGNEFVEEASWSDDDRGAIFFPWIADVDGDGKNEVICGAGRKLVVLDWNGEEFVSTVLAKFNHHVFGCVAKDSDGDGIPEIHVTFRYPELQIWKWNGSGYEKIWEEIWYGEEDTIEAIDIGDVDDDGIPEVCVGTNYIHILQWNGSSYEEEHIITNTYGLLAVTCVGDFDNDGKNEINAGAVGVSEGESYMSWIFKYGWS